jgi:heat shock protein HslJ
VSSAAPRHVVRRVLAFSMVVALLAGTACAERRGQPAPDSSTVDDASGADARFRAQLDRTWELVRLGEQDIRATHPSAFARPSGAYAFGARPTIRFTARPSTAPTDIPGASQLGGRSVCNSYGAAYKAGPGSQLRIHGFQSTLVGCDGADSLESRYFRALGRTQRFELDSAGLRLIAADGSRLVFVAVPDSALSRAKQ